MNVKILNRKALTPDLLLRFVHEELGSVCTMYVIGFDEQNGFHVWTTDDLSQLPAASIVLQDLARDYINGDIFDEEGEPIS